ncbi:hypothetical protein J7L02_04245 [Candidatus Woesearchaeota archaeon]|nr:hypothetical protein [Candidatus Woesearchaeota archaeon]
MAFVKSLKSLTDEEFESKEFDQDLKSLAKLSRKFPTGLALVITPEAFEEFASYNSLKAKILEVLKSTDDLRHAAAKVYLMFQSCEFPSGLKQQVLEAVQALAVNEKNVLKQEKPEALLMFSHGLNAFYCDESEVLSCLKHAWALLHGVKFLKHLKTGFEGLNSKPVVIESVENWSATGVAVYKACNSENLNVNKNGCEEQVIIHVVKGLPPRELLTHVEKFNGWEAFLTYLEKLATDFGMDSFLISNSEVKKTTVRVQNNVLQLSREGIVNKQASFKEQKVNDKLALQIARLAKLCFKEFSVNVLLFAVQEPGQALMTGFQGLQVLRACYLKPSISESIVETEKVKSGASELSDIDIQDALEFITKVESERVESASVEGLESQEHQSLGQELGQQEALEQEQQRQEQQALQEQQQEQARVEQARVVEEKIISEAVKPDLTPEALAITASNVMISSLEFAALAFKKMIQLVTGRDISLELPAQDFVDLSAEALEDIGAFLEPDYRSAVKKLLELREQVLQGSIPSFAEIGACLDNALKVIKWLDTLRKHKN